MSYQYENIDFHVDRHKLLDQWEEQAAAVMEFGLRLADAVTEADSLKSELEILYAELDAQIREDPAEFGLDKTTETAIKNTVLTIPKYQKKLEESQKARHDIDVIRAALTALEHRKHALQAILSAKMAGWYAEPKVKEDARPKKSRTVKRN